MALDPNILLQGRVVDVGQAIQSPLMALNQIEQLKAQQLANQQAQAQAPIATDIMKQRLEQMTQANAMGKLQEYQAKEEMRRGSFLAAAKDLLPTLQSGNISKAKDYLTRRIKTLNDAGIDSTDSQEALDMLNQNKFDELRTGLTSFIDQNKTVKPITLKEDERLVSQVQTPTGVSYKEVFGPAQGGTRAEQRDLTNQMNLRKNYQQQAQPFMDAQQSFGRVKAVFEAGDPKIINKYKSAAKNFSPGIAGKVKAFGDLALMFNYMKMLDPRSTVREGEQASVRNTGGVVDTQFINWYNGILNGSSLTPDQRAGIYIQSQEQYRAVEDQQRTKVKEEIDFAKKNGVEPKYIPQSHLDLLNQRQETAPPVQSVPPEIQNRSYLKYGQ